MFVHYPLFTQNHPPFLYYKKGHILRLLVNCGLSLLPFQVIYCETQILTDQKLTIIYLCPPNQILFSNCEFCFRILALSSHSVVRPWTKVTSHLLSTIWPFIPHKPYIFWKLMTRPIQITSSSAIHQLPISSPLVVTNNDDIVQNLIQFLVQNSHSLLSIYASS